MPSDTLFGLQASGYRLRRRHEKSRNGCVRCKQKRKKVEIPPSFSSSATNEGIAPDLHASPFLDATELSLLSHYLSHTSQIIPVDDLDLYALSVGVPNLGFNCRLVMSSLLALTATCKSHDIAKQAQTPLSPHDLSEIQELLALAERHHTASLRHIHESMQKLESYDEILANAALMVLYASASHSIRVHLAAVTAKRSGRRLQHEMLPQHSQWISFTRAVHTASTAVLNDIVQSADRPRTATTTPSLVESSRSTLRSTAVLSPRDGPSENTKRLFRPLVVSTCTRALEGLRRRAESTAVLLQEPDSGHCRTHPRVRCHLRGGTGQI